MGYGHFHPDTKAQLTRILMYTGTTCTAIHMDTVQERMVMPRMQLHKGGWTGRLDSSACTIPFGRSL
jgi:hypothetical protein